MVKSKTIKNRYPAIRGINSTRRLFACLVCLALLSCSGEAWAAKTAAGQTAAGPAKQVEEKNPLELDDILRPDFVYQRGNRPDPFVPFISEQTIADQVETDEEILAGMRLFEPGQLSLVAITSDGINPLALVQDSTGKGYILKKGIAIGRRGIIKSIISNAVIIEESFLNSAGKKRNRTIEMVLRKEGEK